MVAFLLRRNLDDLVDWLGAILAGDQPEEQARADLEGVRWCLSRRAALEARIEHTHRLLARRRRPRSRWPTGLVVGSVRRTP